MIQILFYLTRFPGVGGIESITNSVISQLLTNKSVSIDILAHQCQEGLPIPNNIGYYLVPDVGKFHTSANYSFVKSLVYQKGYDSIVYQDSYAPTEKIICPIAKQFGVKLYVFEHNTPRYVFNKMAMSSVFTLKGFLRRAFHPYLLFKEIQRKRYLYANAYRYVLLSKSFVSEFCELTHIVNDEKIRVIPNPIMPLLSYNISNKENIILCVARFVKEKNIDKMIVAWRELVARLTNWKFIVVGDGPENDRIRKMAQGIERIEFVGFTDPSIYYEKAKIFWMMSSFEGFGLTLLEASQNACVAIVYDSFSSLHDIIEDGVNGFIIPNGDIDSFISQTEQVANNFPNDICLAAVQKARLFSFENIMPMWYKLLAIS